MMSQFLSSSLLIVGGGKKTRAEKAEKIIGEKISALANNPDFFWLGAAESRGIEEMRSLQKFLQLKSFAGSRKIAFLEEAQNLTLEAQNSLLKTLEEPPAHSLILLTVPESDLLLPTIVSRCEIVQLSLEPQVALNEEEFQARLDLFNKIIGASVGERFTLAEEQAIYKDREGALSWLDEMTYVGYRLLLAHFGMAKSKSLSSCSLPQLLHCLRLVSQTKKYLQANCNLRLAMEIFLIKL